MSIIGNPIMAGVSGPAASIFVTGLSETDTVTATNGSKTLTGKWTQKPNPEIVVPGGYTQLEYIKNSGTQILDTGIAINNDHRIEVKVNSETYDGIWAGFVNPDDYLIRFDRFQFYWGYPSQVISDLFSTGLNVITASKDGIVVNGATHANQYTLKDNTTSFALFGEKRAKAPVGYSPCSFEIEFYYAKIWDNDSLVRDLIPCKRNSDSAVGMYDLVSNTFFENAGTGEFIAGPEVPQTIGCWLLSPIREFGTWTVTATNGERTATQDVLVDVITNYEIEMDLTKLWLYRDGDECEDVTGGWQCWKNSGTSELLDTSIHFASSENNQWQSTSTKTKINLTNFSNLKAEVKLESQMMAQYCELGPTIRTTVDTSKSADGYAVRKQYVADVGDHMITIDISDLDDEYCIAFNSYYVGSAYIYKVWLE